MVLTMVVGMVDGMVDWSVGTKVWTTAAELVGLLADGWVAS